MRRPATAARGGHRSKTAEEPAPRRTLWAIVALGALGVALSIELARIHAGAHAGETSFCSLSEVVNCDRVATSRFSVVLGLPVAVWGIGGFALVTALAAAGLARRRPHPAWPRGLLVLTCGACVAASIALALVSKLAIGAWCLVCAAGWAVSVALLVASWRALPAAGLGAALAADWAAMKARPQRSIAIAGALLGAAAVAAVVYPHYWDRPARAAPAGSAAAQPRARSGTIVLYSDYECPFCARAHETERAALAAHPEIRIVKRHFPLDDACNPKVKRKIHPGACELARAGICAEAQGLSAEMDDALYRSQGQGARALDVAREVGLDLDRFRACLASRETQARLDADIAQAIRDGVRALPTYVADGALYTGALPPDLLPPQPATATGR
jgi:protein-disulfide isomerase